MGGMRRGVVGGWQGGRRACGSSRRPSSTSRLPRPPASAACLAVGLFLRAGLKDAEECIRLAPDFAKGYSRKGHLQFFMKVGRCCCTWGLQGGGGASREQAYLPAACVPTAFLRASALCHPGWLQEFDKAVETYQAGLERDPDNQELKDGLMRCVQAINKVGGWGGAGCVAAAFVELLPAGTYLRLGFQHHASQAFVQLCARVLAGVLATLRRPRSRCATPAVLTLCLLCR